MLVGLLLHLQLNGEDFWLSCLTCSSCLRQGCELASLKHQFASRELTNHQPRWSLGLLLLTSLGGLNLLDLCNLLLGYSLTCCSGTSLGRLLQDQGDPLCFATLEPATQNEIYYDIGQDWTVIQFLDLSDEMKTTK